MMQVHEALSFWSHELILSLIAPTPFCCGEDSIQARKEHLIE